MANQKKTDTMSWDTDQVRQAEAKAPAPAKKKKKRKKRRIHPILSALIYIVCVVLCAALLAGIGWLLANDLLSLNKEFVETTITVEEDDSLSDVAQKLKDAGLIEYKWFFSVTGKLVLHADTIEPGEYILNSDMDYHALIVAMHHVRSFETVKVTIPEGKTVDEIIDLLVENGVSTRDKLEDTAANYEFVGRKYLEGKEPGRVNRLEGYLFPDTYDFYVDGDPAQVFEKMLDNFEKKLNEYDLMDDIENSDYTLDEIIIMASIIEKESNDFDEERANIASVIYNRLNTTDSETYGMLQMDSTIDYALALDGKDRTGFSREDFKGYESDYNTYLHDKFPPGAICNPGLASIKAAVHPNGTDYFYFAAGIDGHSHFFETLEEHEAFINSDQYKRS